MEIAHSIATILGYTVMAIVALTALVLGCLMAWRYCPIRFDVKRDTPSFVQTPGDKLSIDWWVGVSGRREFKWFFGFMLVGDRVEPKVTSLKREAH